MTASGYYGSRLLFHSDKSSALPAVSRSNLNGEKISLHQKFVKNTAQREGLISGKTIQGIAELNLPWWQR